MSGLFITSLTPRRLKYYFRDISSGEEDHRDGLNQNEISTFGRWVGLEPDGERIDKILEHFRELRSNARFIRKVSNVGYDLTFVAPKQISILFGLMDTDISDQIVGSHQRAVAAVLGKVEESVSWGNNQTLDAVGFVHKTSRELDPHLHTHLLVANCVEWVNGRLRAIDSASLYSSVEHFSKLYRLELARELYRTTGILTIDHDVSDTRGPTEIPGFDPELAKLFSKRSEQVKNLMDKWGTRSPGASRTAALMSRREKRVVCDEDLKRHWRAEAENAAGLNDPKSILRMRFAARPREIFRTEDLTGINADIEKLRMRWLHPSRSQGWLRFATYEDDLFDRSRSFSLGKVVAVIHGNKEIVKLVGELDRYCEAIWDPLEVVVLGDPNLDKVAEVADRYSHQNLVIAVQANTLGLHDLGSEFSSMTELSNAATYLGSKLGGLVCDPALQLRSFMADLPEILRHQGVPDHPMDSFVFATRHDRDLARKFIADSIGAKMDNMGFYDGEIVNIYYLPKSYSIEKSQTGVVNLGQESIEYFLGGELKSVSMSEIKPNAMVAPVLIRSQADVVRNNPQGLDFALGIGEFAVIDPAGGVSLYANRRGIRDFTKAVNVSSEIFREPRHISEFDRIRSMKMGTGLFRDW